jgi:hypothetical protein
MYYIIVMLNFTTMRTARGSGGVAVFLCKQTGKRFNIYYNVEKLEKGRMQLLTLPEGLARVTGGGQP